VSLWLPHGDGSEQQKAEDREGRDFTLLGDRLPDDPYHDCPFFRGQYVEWEPDQSFALFLANVEDKVSGLRVDIHRLDFDRQFFVENLIASLDLALRSRRGDGPAISPLIERTDDEWALTTYGIEALRSDFRFKETEFPRRNESGPGVLPKKYRAPKPPNGVDPRYWSSLIRVAETTYPLYRRR
jgi:hypothetical protein